MEEVTDKELLEQYKECVLRMDRKMDGFVQAIKEAEEIIKIIGTHPFFSSYDTSEPARDWLAKYGEKK